MDDRFSSLIKNMKRGDKVTLELTDDDVLNLLEALNFTFETSNFIIQDAHRTGETPLGIDKVKRYMVLADDLMVKIYNSIDMQGVPPRDERH